MNPTARSSKPAAQQTKQSSPKPVQYEKDNIVPSSLLFSSHLVGDEDGYLSLVWFTISEKGASVPSDQPLFYLNTKINAIPNHWSDVVRLQNRPSRNVVFPNGSRGWHPIELDVFNEPEPDMQEAGLTLNVQENPYRDKLRFSATSAKEVAATVELLNLNGEQIMLKRMKLHAGKNDIALDNATNLPPGTYLLRLISTDGKISTKKVIKQ